ncbi:hypothetical protein E2C01_086429 [Portunus trituberculatus]|uniref:Uncharacterized protein n=1 Tax=Portunus trituberculatus TaxID=210409 RepID=A0A5B7JGA7_PORTR|nr:hypothetical protein [Portunus trituberculatus]
MLHESLFKFSPSYLPSRLRLSLPRLLFRLGLHSTRSTGSSSAQREGAAAGSGGAAGEAGVSVGSGGARLLLSEVVQER